MKIENEEKKIEIFQYRVGLLLGATAYPFFGWFSQKYLNTSYDSLSVRSYVGLVALSAFALSFTLLGKRYLRLLLMIATCFAMNNYTYLFSMSNYHYYYSVGITAMPFIIFTFFFSPIDIAVFYTFSIASLYFHLKEFNFVFSVVYLILSLMAFVVYFLITRNRIALLRKVQKNLEKIEIQKDNIELKNQSLARIGDLAAQVAHDIRSPVAALKAVSETLENVDPKKKQLIEKAALRINGIADYLVSEYRTNLTSDLAQKSTQRPAYLNEVIQEIVDEKKIVLEKRAIVYFDAAQMIKLPEYLNIVEFKRILSNLLNNSIEAFDKEESKVDIKLTQNGQGIQISIKDNGKGIPQDILAQLFQKGASFSKAQGTGLGLAHAKQYLESIGGNIKMDSEVGVGTQIIMEFKS